jgi:hypothetical protein
LHLSAKLHWISNLVKRLLRTAGAAHDYRAEIEHATEKTLRDGDALDFTKQRLE